MNERIKELAIEAGDDWEHTLKEDREFLEKFAALVAAAEREECAKICDELFRREPPYTSYAEEAQDCADAIRARGNNA